MPKKQDGTSALGRIALEQLADQQTMFVRQLLWLVDRSIDDLEGKEPSNESARPDQPLWVVASARRDAEESLGDETCSIEARELQCLQQTLLNLASRYERESRRLQRAADRHRPGRPRKKVDPFKALIALGDRATQPRRGPSTEFTPNDAEFLEAIATGSARGQSRRASITEFARSKLQNQHMRLGDRLPKLIKQLEGRYRTLTKRWRS